MCHDECQACKGNGGHHSGGTQGGKFIVCQVCHGAGYFRVDTKAACPYPPGSKQKVAALRARWQSGKRLFKRDDFIDRECEHGVILKGMVATG